MNRRITFIAALVVATASPAVSGASVRTICPGYRIDSEHLIRLSSNEKKLVCGDSGADSWKEIPPFQAKHFLRVFLQQRGYSYPEFVEEDGVITILPGPRAFVKRVEVEGDPPESLRIWRKRSVKGAVLSPALLTTLEDWAKAELKHRGYACPGVSTSADPDKGTVVLHVDPGDKLRIAEVTEDEVDGLRPGTLRRFDAFRKGDVYDSRNLAVTTERIESNGVLQSSHFQTECAPEGAKLHQRNIPGPTRLFSIGFGANSEDYFVIKADWKQARLGKNASSFEISGWGSYRKQNITLQGLLFPLPKPSRWYLNPFLSNRRVNESRYNYFAVDVWAPPAVTWESAGAHYRLAFGPKYNFTRTFSGARSGPTHFVSASVRFEAISHDYEYRIANRQSGYVFSASADLNSDEVLSSVTAQNLAIAGQALWNVAGLDPPLFVVGLRGLAQTTITDTGSASFPRLPPQFLSYLGGSQDLRGFKRKELPNASRGALTALYAGLEVQLANVLPLNIQPIVFVDVGAMGQDTLSLDRPAYWSPGFGVRWPSLIGIFRATAAHGYLIRNDDPANGRLSHWQYYISIGEEF